MSNPIIPRYALDTTGNNISNLVSGEVVNLVNRAIRSIAPMYGAYYADSMVITDLSTGKTLTSDQWYPGELYEVPTAKYGKPIYAVVLITDTTVSNNVSIQYQAVGGEYGANTTAIIDLINNLAIDNRPVYWPNIVHKPATYPPSEHLHDVGTVYGFEYVVHALERVKSAIEFGDQVALTQVYKYIDARFAALNNTVINELLPDIVYFNGNDIVMNPNIADESELLFLNA